MSMKKRPIYFLFKHSHLISALLLINFLSTPLYAQEKPQVWNSLDSAYLYVMEKQIEELKRKSWNPDPAKQKVLQEHINKGLDAYLASVKANEPVLPDVGPKPYPNEPLEVMLRWRAQMETYVAVREFEQTIPLEMIKYLKGAVKNPKRDFGYKLIHDLADKSIDVHGETVRIQAARLCDFFRVRNE